MVCYSSSSILDILAGSKTGLRPLKMDKYIYAASLTGFSNSAREPFQLRKPRVYVTLEEIPDPI